MKTSILASLLLMSIPVSAAPVTSCVALFQAYAEIQQRDETLPVLFKDPEYADISKEPHRAMIMGVRDLVGSFQCDSKGALEQLELDYNAEFVDDKQQKRLALLRFEKVAVALIQAFTSENEKAAKFTYGRVSLPAMLRAHNAVLRGDDDPNGEASAPIAPGFEIRVKITHEGPTLFVQRLGYDK